MSLWDHVWLGVAAIFQGPALIEIAGVPIPVTLVMILFGFLIGILVGATPGLAGPMAMAVALPILISMFGYEADALLPVLGFLIGVMKGATIGGAVPAILFNTPGTPDAYMTTLDGHPMARKGQAGKALRIAHISSASGDTFSDIVLILCAPFLAVMVESYLDLPEKTALLLLSMAFIAAVIGGSVAKGLISTALGLLAAFVATGEDFYPRLTMDIPALSQGFPVAASLLGILIVGEIFKSLEDEWRRGPHTAQSETSKSSGSQRVSLADVRDIAPHVSRSAVIGTVIGALPGIGSTLAATLGYTFARQKHDKAHPDGPGFGTGAKEGIAATEAANSSVSGANLIPVLSLGIPGNTAAVFLILAMDSIGGFNPGPAVFRVPSEGVNSELVIAFGLFTAMFVANGLNWTIGGVFMRWAGIMARIPKHVLLPIVLLMTLTAIYVQETRLVAVWFTIGFGVLGYLMRRISMSPLPFVVAFILGGRLEDSARQAFSATGSDPFFLFSSITSSCLMVLAVFVIFFSLRRNATSLS